jgi:hypothetical protein
MATRRGKRTYRGCRLAEIAGIDCREQRRGGKDEKRGVTTSSLRGSLYLPSSMGDAVQEPGCGAIAGSSPIKTKRISRVAGQGSGGPHLTKALLFSGRPNRDKPFDTRGGVLGAHLRDIHVGHALGCSPFHRARHSARSIYHNRLQHGNNDSNHLVFFLRFFFFFFTSLCRSPPSFRLSLASMSSPSPHSPLLAHDKSPSSKRKDRPPALDILNASASPSHLPDRHPSAEDTKSHVEQVMSPLPRSHLNPSSCPSYITISPMMTFMCTFPLAQHLPRRPSIRTTSAYTLPPVLPYPLSRTLLISAGPQKHVQPLRIL